MTLKGKKKTTMDFIRNNNKQQVRKHTCINGFNTLLVSENKEHFKEINLYA